MFRLGFSLPAFHPFDLGVRKQEQLIPAIVGRDRLHRILRNAEPASDVRLASVIIEPIRQQSVEELEVSFGVGLTRSKFGVPQQAFHNQITFIASVVTQNRPLMVT